VHALEVFADYHQFYIGDTGVGPMAPTDYTDEDVRCRVKVAPNVVVIQPERNMTVPVEIELRDADAGFDEAEWDHVAECSIDLRTGRLQVHECTGGPLLDLNVAPGSYRVRAVFAGLGTLSDDGLDGEDRYRVVLWPSPMAPLQVVKQWPVSGQANPALHPTQPSRRG
jgi:hypothetical protein